MYSISLLIKDRRNDGGKINLSFYFFTHKGEEISFIPLLQIYQNFFFYFFTHKGEEKCLLREARYSLGKINLSISLLIKDRRFPYDDKQRRLFLYS